MILITGCSSPAGIGFAAAHGLAEAGHRVHATVRDHSHVASLTQGLEDRLTVHEMDLLDHATVLRTVDAVIQTDGRLDVLVNNAGYGLIGGIEQVELDRARAHFETNFFGTLGLIQEVLPVMRRQHGGHIVNVSTIFAAALTPPALGYYIASKSALESACQALSVEVAPWAIRVTNFQPGPVMTNLEREWGDRLPAEADPLPDLSDRLYQWVLGGHGPAAQEPAEVAVALCDLIDSPSPPLSAQSSTAATDYVGTALRDPSRASELKALAEAFQASSLTP